MHVFALSLSCCVLIRTSCPSWGMDVGVIRPPIHPARQNPPTAHWNIILLPCNVCKKVNSTVKEIQEIQEASRKYTLTYLGIIHLHVLKLMTISLKVYYLWGLWARAQPQTLRWSLPVCLSISATTSLPFCWAHVNTHAHTYLKAELHCSIMFY